ncbi:hypothetical protein [Qipengyuania qiaonensis]|uniref:Uncharacterized protein n=1 Tax=Qipengyuania qiaonensis TaxID=2867240 RepID=A0ABS7J5X2_9SPHN|nr:hypothetical protein [Qipengyuania qiaonensis]MBX7482740.1 hypothetical protein [Qipengyuania qiaonensis]
MSNDIRARLSGVGATGRISAGNGRGQTHAALTSLAGRVAEQVAHSLELLGGSGDGGSRGRNFIQPGDLYDVRRQSNELARELGADAAQSARLNRALDRFAEACATLIAAQPAAFSVERVRAVVEEQGANGAAENAESACAAIEHASRAVEEARW